MRLRPHHSMCLQFFVGKGYSAPFNRKMSETLSLPSDTKVTVTFGLDDICGHCPNHPDGKCTSEAHVSEIDSAVASILLWTEGSETTLGEFIARAEQDITRKGLLRKTCRNCSFMEICAPLAEGKKEPRT